MEDGKREKRESDKVSKGSKDNDSKKTVVRTKGVMFEEQVSENTQKTKQMILQEGESKKGRVASC